MVTQLVHVAPAVQHVERFAQDLGQGLVRAVGIGVDQEPHEQFERAQRLRKVGLERLQDDFRQPTRARSGRNLKPEATHLSEREQLVPLLKLVKSFDENCERGCLFLLRIVHGRYAHARRKREEALGIREHGTIRDDLYGMDSFPPVCLVRE